MSQKVSSVFMVGVILVVLCSSHLKAASSSISAGNSLEALLISEPSGTLKGVVLEQGTDEPLIGASVVLKGTSKGTATDENGEFTIRNLEAGAQVFVISYLGFQTKEITVEIEDNETAEIEVMLSWGGVEGEEVTITAQARGQVAAINQQLQSNTIANVVSKDRIQELPDVNAAESIGRLPGIAIQRTGGEANKVLIRGLSPKFTNITVNGVRIPSTGGDDRSVDLSLVSSNMLDGIEVKKAITPDMDGDAIAGSVDLKLRDAPEGLTFDLQGQGGYTQLQDYYGNYKFSGTASNRFFNNKLGVIATFNVDKYDRSADQMQANYARYDFPATDDIGVRLTSVSAQENTNLRTRNGASLVMDYRIPDGKITANTFYNQLSDEGLTRLNNIYGGRVSNNLNINDWTTSIFTSAVSMEKDFGWVKMNAGVSRSSSLAKSPKNYFGEFRIESESLGFDTDTFPRDSIGIQPIGVLPWSTPNDTIMVLGSANTNSTRREETTYITELNLTFPFQVGDNIDGFIKTGGKVRWFDKSNDENQRGNQFAYWDWDYDENTGEPLGNNANVLRCISDIMGSFNGYNLYQDRIVNASTTGLTAESRSIPIFFFDNNYSRSNFLTGEGGDGFPIGYTADPELVKEFIQAAEQCNGTDGLDTIREDPRASRGRDYSGEERYDAAYIMSELNIGDYVTLIPGVRWEHDYSRYTSERFEVASTTQGDVVRFADTLDVTRNYNFILPMFHVQVDPSDWLKIRLAYTETLARPDYTQYIPRANIYGRPPQVEANNTQLKPAEAFNYDLSASVYQNYVGLFTVSGFHKTLKDLPLWKRSSLNTVDSLPNADDLNIPYGRDFDNDGMPDEPDWLNENVSSVTTYINSPFDTKVWGVEFDWQTNFWYMPSLLRGLVLNINYTRMFSETSYQTTVKSHLECLSNCGTIFQESVQIYKDTLRTGYRAIDQPAHLANITLGYDYKGFSTRLSYLYQGDRLTNVPSATEPVRDAYSATYERWDLTVKQKINDNIELFGNFSNLTSTPDRNLVGGNGDQSLGFGSPTYVQYYGFTMDVGVRLRY